MDIVDISILAEDLKCTILVCVCVLITESSGKHKRNVQKFVHHFKIIVCVQQRGIRNWTFFYFFAAIFLKREREAKEENKNN
jgi:hypothetical protein